MKSSSVDLGLLNDGYLDTFDLPIQIAILNGSGTIVATDDNWQSCPNSSPIWMDAISPRTDLLAVLGDLDGRHANEIRKGISKILSGRQETFEAQYSFDTKSGIRWFRLAVGSLGAGDERLVKIVQLEITQQKRLQRQLQHHRANQDRLITQTPFPIVTIDSDWQIRKTNDPAAELFGVEKPVNLREQGILELVHPEDEKSVRDRLNRLLEGVPIGPGTNTLLGLDGIQRTFMWAAVPFVRNGNTRVLVFGNEVPQSKDRGRTSQRFQQTSRDFTRAETPAEVISDLKRKHALMPAQSVELTFRISDHECLFSRMADVLEGQIRFEKLIKRESNTKVFVSMYDVDPETVQDLPAHIDSIHTVDILRQQGANKISARISISEPFLGTVFSKVGGMVAEIAIEQSSCRVVATVPDIDIVPSIKASLDEHFPTTQLVSKRPLETEEEIVNGRPSFKDKLTERQLEVFQTAYHAGYFESPRATKGEDIAGILDITSQAFYQHIRTIQRKFANTVIGE